ncbi:MAG: hypothetical protein ACFFCW_00505 [Candidatus Hodarchaeota archaeon]
MSRTPDEYIFDAYMQEYEKHRDEIQNRINLQNGMGQRGLNLTFLAATLLASLFTFFMSNYGKSQENMSLQDKINFFRCIGIPILFLHGVLLQLTAANWIYQLNMIFRIVRYWNWIVVNKLNNIIGSKNQVYLWDLIKDPPWATLVEKRFVRYFQPAFLYALCLPAFLGFPLAFFWKDPTCMYEVVRWFSFICYPFLALTLIFLIIIHRKVYSSFEDSQIYLVPEINKVEDSQNSQELGDEEDALHNES